MHNFLLEMFACPACYGTLKWDIMEQRDGLPVADTVLEWGVLVAHRAASITS